ncbi:MAG: hypothetical protein ACJAYB_000010 [Psychromonas sp.]|jgi:hypothetical protein
MLLTKVFFQKLSKELINEHFGDFKEPLVLTSSGGADYLTQSVVTNGIDNIEGIRGDYESSQIDGVNIVRGDFFVTAERQLITVDLSPGNLSATFNGLPVNIESITTDTADAATTFQMRTK